MPAAWSAGWTESLAAAYRRCLATGSAYIWIAPDGRVTDVAPCGAKSYAAGWSARWSDGGSSAAAAADGSAAAAAADVRRGDRSV